MGSRRNGPARRSVATAIAVLTLLCASLTQASAAALPRARAAAGLAITTRPALQPLFDPAVHDYVTSCEPAEMMRISVQDTTRMPVAVDRQPVQTGSFRTFLRLGGGQSFVMTTGAGSSRSDYRVRCLPADFPAFSVQVFARPQAAYYLLTPSAATATAPAAPYVALFDSHGVPIWWYRDPNGDAPTNATVLSNGDLSWSLEKPIIGEQLPSALTLQVTQGFGLPGETDIVEHRLDGAVVRTLDTVGSPTDFHEGLQLPDGNFLITSYVVRTNANLTPVFFAPATALDASFQVISPGGDLVYAWNAAGRISPSESTGWELALDFGYPDLPGPVWDYQHIDSVAPDGDGYLISLSHTNAVYLVRASDGAIEWKLGGTKTAQSLRIIGDQYASSDFGGQDDARVWPDGTVSVYDDGISRRRAPRVLRFRIDPQAGTATLVQSLSDPAAPASPCCGSAQLLPAGDWVVAWGGTQIVDELSANGQPVLRLTLAQPYFSYRAVPVLPGQLSYGTLIRGMNTMNPRIASGDRPPALSGLRVSPGRKGLRVHFTLGWRATVRFSLQRAAAGRFVPVGASFRRASQGGTNRLVVSGRIAGRPLVPGTYRLIATPVAGRRKGDQSIARFRIR